jgi:hypothetical protein
MMEMYFHSSFSIFTCPKHTGVLGFSKWASTFQKGNLGFDLDGTSIFKGTDEK